MKKKIFPIITNSILIIVVFFTTKLNDANAQSKAEKIDAVITEFAKYNRFNGSALVAEKGKVVFKKGYGMANMEWNIPNQPDTKFRIASITKPFTSMTIMKLVDDGKISLEGKLSDYLPYYRKDTGSRITIHHLLTHTSGLPDFSHDDKFWEEESRDSHDPKDYIIGHCSHDFINEPGEVFAYNNSGFDLLGAVIEEVTGKPYGEALRDIVLEPLGLNNTGYEMMTDLIPNKAGGYSRMGMEYRKERYYDMSHPYASGGLYSSVEDFYKFDRALAARKLLSENAYNKLFTPYEVRSSNSSYGYGWEINKTSDGKDMIGHTGALGTFICDFKRIPEDDILIVLLTNTGLDALGSSSLRHIRGRILSILNGEPYTMPKIPVSEIVIKDFKNRNNIDDIIKKVREINDIESDKYSTSSRECFFVGSALIEENEYEYAIKFLEFGIEINPDSPILYYKIGEAYMEKGDRALAIKNFSKAIEINPRFPWPYAKLREILK